MRTPEIAVMKVHKTAATVCLALMCAVSVIGSASQAAIAETVIVLDDSDDDVKDHHVDLFKTEYGDAGGSVAAKSLDGKGILAPGTSGEHMIRIRNANSYTIEYEINVDTCAKNGPGGQLPICTRVTAGLESGKAWQYISGTVTQTLRGVLSPQQEMSFYYQWRWEGDDHEMDTMLAEEYGDMTLEVLADISAREKTYEPSGSGSGGSGSSSSSGSGSGGGSGSGSSGSGGSSVARGVSPRGAASSKTSGPGAIGTGGIAVSGLYGSGGYVYGIYGGPGVNGTLKDAGTAAKAVGWVKDSQTGEWYYSLAGTDAALSALKGADLSKLHTGWLYEMRDGRWYYLMPGSGRMCNGWQMIDGFWYYFTEREAADEAAWSAEETKGGHAVWKYYGSGAHSYGSMYIREYTPDGYFVDSEGRWVEGG